MNRRELHSWELTALPRGSLLHWRVLQTFRIRSHKSVCTARDGQLSQQSCWRCTHCAIQHCVVRRVVTDVSKDCVAFTVKVRSTTPGTTHLRVRPRAQPNPQSVPFLHFLHCRRNSDGPTVGTCLTRKCAAAENNLWTSGQTWGSLIWGHFVTDFGWLPVVVHSALHLLHSFDFGWPLTVVHSALHLLHIFDFGRLLTVVLSVLHLLRSFDFGWPLTVVHSALHLLHNFDFGWPLTVVRSALHLLHSFHFGCLPTVVRSAFLLLHSFDFGWPLTVVHSALHLAHSFDVCLSQCELFYRHHSKRFAYGRARDVTTYPPALEKKREVDRVFIVDWRQGVWGQCRMVAPGVCLKGSGQRGSWLRPRVAWN